MAKKESKKARKKRLASEGLQGEALKLESNKQTISSKNLKPKFNVKQLWPLALVLLFTFICFYPSLDNAFVNWDDDKNFFENELITTINDKNFWDNTKQIFVTPVIGNYNPLSIFTFAIEQKLFGLDQPMYWHLDNILLHLICVFFVYLIGIQLGLGTPATVLFALLFAVHPMRVESVTWVTERKDVLFGAFYLAALYYYIKSYKYGSNYKYLAIIWICFILSLLSKIQAVILPISMILVDYYFSNKISFKSILKKAPYFMASLATGLIGIYFLKDQGSLETADNYAAIDRLFVGSFSLVVYYIKALIPYELSPLYPYPTKVPWYFYPSMLSFIGTAGFLWVAYKRQWKVAFFGIAFFTANIFFLLQILGAGQGFIADRFSYIAYIGLCFILAYYFDKLLAEKQNMKMPIMGIAGALILAYGFMTFNQTKIWKDSGTLWTHVLKYYNKVTLPYGNRANFYRDQGMVSKALADYSQTIRLKPNVAAPYNSRGRLYFNFEHPDSIRKALADYSKAIELEPDGDEYYINRGATYAKLGDYDNALVNLNKGIELDPTFSNGYLNRSVIYNIKGDRPNALKDVESYLKLKPYSPDIWFECSQFRNLLGNKQGALEAVNKAIAYNKNKGQFYFGRAALLFDMGRVQEAKNDVNKSIQLGYKGDAATSQAILKAN